jgi:hypothetical protein
MIVNGEDERRIVHGIQVVGGSDTQTDPPPDWCRAYGPSGEFLAIMRFDPNTDAWQPSKVFAHLPSSSVKAP